MDQLDAMRLFVRVAELESFTRCAEQTGIPKATLSAAIRRLEERMGTRLLLRTTRRVQLTTDGQLCYARCRELLADMEEFDGLFRQGGQISGQLRVDMPSRMARHLVIPALPDFLAQHPALQLMLSSTDRRVDLVREGFDCVIRVGPVAEPGLVARPLGQVRVATCASPAYLARLGTPHTLQDLAAHELVHYVSTLGTRSAGFEVQEGDATIFLPMGGRVTVNSAEAYLGACLAGLGLIQVPLLGAQDLVEQGLLVPVLAQHPPPPMPVTLLYAHRRHLPQRVRVVMDWLAAVVQAKLGQTPAPRAL